MTPISSIAAGTISTGTSAHDTALEPAPATTVVVELFHVELDGCLPCAHAIAEVDEAASLVHDELDARGRTLLVRTVALHEPGHAQARGIDNPVRVRVAGADVSPAGADGHLAACGVSGAAPKSCRAYSWNGQVYDAPPAGLIVEAIHRHLDAGTDPGHEEAIDQFLRGRAAGR
ncbi:MAG TPA: DUF2703 domain-containing protein [Marmoricola sp.]|nr:DUF2703 domain-containing protein [Marmoricola sp.]